MYFLPKIIKLAHNWRSYCENGRVQFSHTA